MKSKTQTLRNTALNRVLDGAGFILLAVGLAAIAAKLLGWKGDPIGVVLRLPLLVLIPCCIIVSGISAEILVLVFREGFPSVARWSERVHFRLLIALWILVAVCQIAFVIWFR